MLNHPIKTNYAENILSLTYVHGLQYAVFTWASELEFFLFFPFFYVYFLNINVFFWLSKR